MIAAVITVVIDYFIGQSLFGGNSISILALRERDRRSRRGHRDREGR